MKLFKKKSKLEKDRELVEIRLREVIQMARGIDFSEDEIKGIIIEVINKEIG